VRDLKVGKIAGADFVEITPLVVMVAFGMGMYEIIRTELVEHDGIHCDHGSIAPFLKSLDIVDRCIVWHAVEPVMPVGRLVMTTKQKRPSPLRLRQ
jgi:hypothetical protein